MNKIWRPLFSTGFRLIPTRQWFPTGLPRHTRVPKGGVRGAASFNIYRDIRLILTPRGAGLHLNNPVRVPWDTKGWKTLPWGLSMLCNNSIRDLCSELTFFPKKEQFDRFVWKRHFLRLTFGTGGEKNVKSWKIQKNFVQSKSDQ